MTREEAKDFLYSISRNLGLEYIENYTSYDGKKMREAIKALEQEPCEDAASRKTMTIEDMRKRVLDNFERAIKEDYKLRSQAEVHYTATFERISMAWELGIIDYETWLKLVKRLDEKY